MTSERKQIPWTAAYAHRVATRVRRFRSCQQGPQDPRIINLGISKAQVDPVGRQQATSHRRQATGRRPKAFVPRVSSLESQASSFPTRKDKNRN